MTASGFPFLPQTQILENYTTKFDNNYRYFIHFCFLNILHQIHPYFCQTHFCSSVLSFLFKQIARDEYILAFVTNQKCEKEKKNTRREDNLIWFGIQIIDWCSNLWPNRWKFTKTNSLQRNNLFVRLKKILFFLLTLYFENLR